MVDCVVQAINMVANQAERGKVALVWDRKARIPDVRGDDKKLRQILINLLSNAVKFTPPGGKVQVLAGLEPDGQLRIDVRDSGVGIAEHDLERVFEPFAQADGSRTREHGGTGLGLALSRAMVELHDGTVGIESAPGAGTRVTLRLPAARVRAAAA